MLTATEPFYSATYDYRLGETAIAIAIAFEDYCLINRETMPQDHPCRPCEVTVAKWVENVGAGERRATAWCLAALAEKVWMVLSEDDRDAITWDWDFIPTFVLYGVNYWLTMQENCNRNPKAVLGDLLDGVKKHNDYHGNTSSDWPNPLEYAL